MSHVLYYAYTITLVRVCSYGFSVDIQMQDCDKVSVLQVNGCVYVFVCDFSAAAAWNMLSLVLISGWNFECTEYISVVFLHSRCSLVMMRR